MSVSFLKKLTVREAGLSMAELEKTAVAAAGETVSVLRIVGSLTGSEAQQSSYGPYVAFDGEFAGVNLASGQEYRSGKLILPQVAEAPLNQILSSREDETVKVKFAIDLTVIENKSLKGGTKFKYGVTPLIESSQDDELGKMLKSLPAPGPKAGKKK